MPFQSEKQRRYLWANEPKIARDWADTYGSRIEKNDGGIMDVPRRRYFTGAYGVGGTENKGSSNKGSAAPGGTGNQGPAHLSHNAPKGPTLATSGGDKKGPAHLSHNAPPPKKPIIDHKAQKEAKEVAQWKKQNRTWPQQIKQNSLNRNKVLSMRNLGLMPKGMPGLWGNLISGMTGEVPAWAEDLSEEELMQIATSGPYLSQQKTKGDASRLGRGRDLLGRVTEGEGLLNRGELTASEWERLFPTKNMNQAGGGGGDGQGGGYMGYPSYEAWKAAQGTGATAAKTAEPLSAFQQSLTAGANNPFDYYVGKDPGAQNLAWGKQMGVDPRTMGLTSFAADGGRIPAAFGGIMDSSTGRRAYGFGSIFKKVGRAAKKVLGSKVGKAALGIGAMMYAPKFMGQWQGKTGFGGSLQKLMMGKPWQKGPQSGVKGGLLKSIFGGGKGALESGWNPWKLGIGAASALPFFMGGEEEDEGSKFDYMGAKNAYADEIMRLRRGVKAGNLTDEATQSFLPVNYKEGGRIGYYAGGQSTPSDYTIEDATMTTTQDKLGGITDVMKQADLFRKGSVGQFYAANGGSADAKLLARVQELQDEGLDYNSAMAQALKELSQGKAQGGRIGYAGGARTKTLEELLEEIKLKESRALPSPEKHAEYKRLPPWLKNYELPSNRAQGGRIGADEGGLMDLGGMEKDYRNDGGFVPLGGEEKADDVPARLSKNEFVFTADAVRGAGDGDIDKGAEIMENIMKNLEQGGQISEETQGLSGAQEMFGVSERLSEVV